MSCNVVTLPPWNMRANIEHGLKKPQQQAFPLNLHKPQFFKVSLYQFLYHLALNS